MAESLTLPAFAKINWILKILGRRPDGFHEILTVLQTIQLHDRIRIVPASRPGISLQVSGAQVPVSPDNLVWKAAEVFCRRTGRVPRFHFELEKRIPVGAGLGGGSADAAVVLLGLNSLLGRPLGRARLASLAAELGSDVPFFLFGGTALAQGRGELLEPWDDVLPSDLLLLYPGFQVAAGRAYSLGGWPDLDAVSELTKDEANNRIRRFQGRIRLSEPVLDLVENDFDGPLLEHYPELGRATASLKQAGCEIVVVCGSGSTVLGIPPAGKIETVRGKSPVQERTTLLSSRTLSRRAYRSHLEAAGLLWPSVESVE